MVLLFLKLYVLIFFTDFVDATVAVAAAVDVVITAVLSRFMTEKQMSY